MVAHVEFFTIDLSEREQWVDALRQILDYYRRNFPNVVKMPMMPISDYEDVNPKTVTNPQEQVMVLETFESVEAMKKARAEKFNDPEWKELMSKGGLKPANFTHSFCEILE